ncbi:MAG: hypothetical protein WBB69_06570 [Anaerolineales bacterium]
MTESDIELKILENEDFQKFTTGETKPDIYQRVLRIEADDLTLSELSSEYQERISRCINPPQFGRGSFILPPLIHGHTEETCFLDSPSVQNPFVVPLLRSPLVKERLDACLNHPEQIGLILHVFSIVIFDYRLHRIDLFYRSDQSWVFENIPMDNGFRRMFTSCLPSFSALMLHSSGVVHGGRAALFLAPDAGGKSTTLKNLYDGVILCDDQNILRKEGDTFIVHSTPWGAINGGQQQAQLGGFFLLEKAPSFELIRLKPQDVFLFLWEEHMHVWLRLPKSLRIKAFELLYEACSRVPCYRMCFPKDYVDWDAIDAAMEL